MEEYHVSPGTWKYTGINELENDNLENSNINPCRNEGNIWEGGRATNTNKTSHYRWKQYVL